MAGSELHPADRLAFDYAQVAEPVWNRIETAAEAANLREDTLLHAGPAIPDPADAALPILHSACVAAVWEGLAPDLETADGMILSGELRLQPAQDQGVVTPLAAVVSASMPLHCVYDAHRGRTRVYAPINGGSGPAMRLGLKSMEVVEHLRWLNGEFSDALREGLAEGIPLVPIAAGSLTEGDDCHGRTPAATRMLIEEMCARGGGHSNDRIRDFMESSPSLFLNLWMAATKCAMSAAEGVDGSGFITAAGGNGKVTGIQVSGLPGKWFTADAAPPRGRIAGIDAGRALGAIGDSAVVDAFGLGAMALHLSPEQAKAFEGFVPEDAARRRDSLTIGRPLGFSSLQLKLGISARNVAEVGTTPMVGLGILDSQGLAGRIGGGIYLMPPEVFADAVAALDTVGA